MEKKLNYKEICVSFVHGYSQLDRFVPGEERPALWRVTPEGNEIFKYVFPRNPRDFKELDVDIAGTAPLPTAMDFETLPRFGFTGLRKHDGKYYAGSWNGVYEIDGETFELNRIISNQLMNDIHGLWADEHGILTVLTSKDAVVLTDYEGNVVDHFSIGKDLSISRQKNLMDIDWRFVSKQFRGSCGFWHFNYVQRIGDEIWITSRSANAFVVVNTRTGNVHMRLMNLCTPVLLHDGEYVGDEFYFTSIDGKIIIAEDSRTTDRVDREAVDDIGIYNRDLVTTLIRLEETDFGREPNWCRGIGVMDDVIVVTVDGRYDTDLSFGLAGVTREGKLQLDERLRWVDIDDETLLRYVTGFDLHIVKD